MGGLAMQYLPQNAVIPLILSGYNPSEIIAYIKEQYFMWLCLHLFSFIVI